MNKNYFIFCNDDIWKNGFCDGTIIAGGCLSASESEGYYVSCALDSHENDTEWDDVQIQMDILPGSYVRFKAFASNDKYIKHNNEKYSIDEIITGNILSAQEKRVFLMEMMKVSYINPDKAPLFSQRGRYLWFSLEFMPVEGSCIVMNSIRLSYSPDTYMNLLPDVYSLYDKDAFMKCFVTIFQSVFEEFDEEIVNVYRQFDIDFTDRNGLVDMAKLKGIEVSDIWDREKLYRLLKVLNNVYCMKGTKWALSQLISIFTGDEPLITEPEESQDGELGAYTFKIFLPYKCINSGRQYEELMYLINKFKPVYTKAELVLLRPELTLDGNTYLGENTVLDDHIGLILDGSVTLSEDSFGNGIML